MVRGGCERVGARTVPVTTRHNQTCHPPTRHFRPRLVKAAAAPSGEAGCGREGAAQGPGGHSQAPGPGGAGEPQRHLLRMFFFLTEEAKRSEKTLESA